MLLLATNFKFMPSKDSKKPADKTPVVPIANADAPPAPPADAPVTMPDAPVTTLPTTDANLNANNAPPPPDAPPVPDAPKQPPTDEEILADLTQKWNDAEDAYADARKKTASFDELRKLKMIAHKAFDAINAHNNAVAAKAAQVETDRKINEYLGIIPQLLKAYDTNKLATEALAQIPVGERTPEILADANKHNERFNELLAETNERLKTAFGKSKTIVFAPQGMTGKQLEKQTGASTNGSKSKTDELFELMDAGKTYDELIASGYADGTIRSAAWKGSYGKNSDGSYTKKSKS